jgi:hypothetical protein
MDETFVQANFSTRQEADEAVLYFTQRGVPATAVQVLEGAEPVIAAPAPVGPALGFGVTPEATNALIEEAAEESVSVSEERVYVVSVNTEGDVSRLKLAREFFGYVV